MVKKIIYKKDGAALATVIIILAVIMVISMSVSMIFSNNLKQVKHQEHHMQSYYIALSGIELAYSALMAEEESTGEQLYETFKWDTDAYTDIDDDLQEKFDSGNFPITDTVDVDGNNVLITITPENRDGEREIKIQSLATLNSTGSTKSITLIFNAENEQDRRWE